MKRVESGAKFDYPPTTEYDPKTVFRHVFGVHIANDDAAVADVRVRLRGNFAKYAASHRWHESQRIDRVSKTEVDLYLQVRPCPELVQWLLSLGPDAEVIAPASLRKEVLDRARATVAAYARRPGLARTTEVVTAARKPRAARRRRA